MRFDRPRQGDAPDEGDKPAEPNRYLDPAELPGVVRRIREAMDEQARLEDAQTEPDQSAEPPGRAKIDRLLKLHQGDKATDQPTVDEPPMPDRLPNVEAVTVDRRKFGEYSMDPANLNNGGKWKAWQALGYDVHDPDARRKASDEVSDRLQRRLPDLAVVDQKVETRVTKYELRDDIVGPNGKAATLRTFWRVGKGATTPRLITNWAEIHTDQDQGGNR